ncbi:hypothetical protein KUTeg_001765 [Tegillarca granosa]|uniref:RNA polymerase II subunit A C-terminal domain phosphatase SSU72 n=1 Tax=Tegillarca granosa TaxID=220873 RepID=A0ABQ9FSE0_TEGGR|nr:hypothetical protein KUTeg_001765 [Tegillarca granosa]
MPDLRIAVVCSSNQNRSMEAHSFMSYTQNGILHMLDRNRRIKQKPERWQACKDKFEVVISCEERVYDQIIEEKKTGDHHCHIINIDIQDNHEEATIGAFMICDLITMIQDSDDLDNDIDEILQEFETRAKRTILHTVSFY